MTTNNDLLRLENVSVRLGGRQILQDVSFSIAPGQFTADLAATTSAPTMERIVIALPKEVIVAAKSPRPRFAAKTMGEVVDDSLSL